MLEEGNENGFNGSEHFITKNNKLNPLQNTQIECDGYGGTWYSWQNRQGWGGGRVIACYTDTDRGRRQPFFLPTLHSPCLRLNPIMAFSFLFFFFSSCFIFFISKIIHCNNVKSNPKDFHWDSRSSGSLWARSYMFSVHDSGKMFSKQVLGTRAFRLRALWNVLGTPSFRFKIYTHLCLRSMTYWPVFSKGN